MKLVHRVVIMENEVALRALFKTELEKEGLEVRIAQSVRRLTDLVMNDRFDATVIDIRMSPVGTEGLDAIKQIRGIRPDLYIEVQTAFKQYVKSAREAGADRIFIKPEGSGPGSATRIKNSILEKKLEFLDNVAGSNLRSSVRRHKNGDQDSAWAVVNASVLADCFNETRYFFDSKSQDYDISREKAEELTRELIAFIATHLIGGRMHPLNMRVAQDLLEDENYRAYAEQKHQLEKQYLNQYVALVHGCLVHSDTNIEELHRKLDKSYPHEPAFIKKISVQERTINLSIPRGVFRR